MELRGPIWPIFFFNAHTWRKFATNLLVLTCLLTNREVFDLRTSDLLQKLVRLVIVLNKKLGQEKNFN